MQKQVCNPQLIHDQLARTEGQVAGIKRMVESGRVCGDVIQQIVAARASLQKLGTLLLQAEAEGCFGSGKNSGKINDLEKIVSQLFKIT